MSSPALGKRKTGEEEEANKDTGIVKKQKILKQTTLSFSVVPSTKLQTDGNKQDFNRYDLGMGSIAHYWPQFIGKSRAKQLFDELMTLNFGRGTITLRGGKTVDTPRLQQWMGDDKLDGRVSLYQKHKPEPWSENMKILRQEIENVIPNFKFDYLLINLYRNGDDYISWHSDSEAVEEGKNVVASISLGATRRFLLKHSINKDSEPVEFQLQSGSLLTMEGTLQRYYKHTVPKQKK
eukprot:TRINITY_DN6008_c0_g1_i1.p1 TRINITY_DN6008_c0_g1~~TRINITY_DN6008_c0_g1_i1.p1  ORF type:complete len:236 (+),score=54.22 TRINITY_DN6008_c0_g1_i1:725-1432(+)